MIFYWTALFCLILLIIALVFRYIASDKGIDHYEKFDYSDDDESDLFSNK